jgi:hypothetical protein
VSGRALLIARDKSLKHSPETFWLMMTFKHVVSFIVIAGILLLLNVAVGKIQKYLNLQGFSRHGENMAKRAYYLTNAEPGSVNPDSKELAEIIISRMGLSPRKKGSTDQMYKVMIELYERMKLSAKEKKPELAVLTVEEMGNHAGISRQTMYDYIKRWLDLDLISKTTYIYENKVIVGYKLNGVTLENAFEKSTVRIKNNLEQSLRLVRDLQNTIKKEKISETMKQKDN